MKKYLICDNCGDKTQSEINGVPVCYKCRECYLDDQKVMDERLDVLCLEDLIDAMGK